MGNKNMNYFVLVGLKKALIICHMYCYVGKFLMKFFVVLKKKKVNKNTTHITLGNIEIICKLFIETLIFQLIILLLYNDFLHFF